MRIVRVRNKTANTIILEKVHVAEAYFDRLIGLLGRDGLEEGEGMMIRPCNSVHSFHMKFLFDVAFFDKNNKAIHIIHSMEPSKFSPLVRNAEYVIETAGNYLKSKLKVDDEIEII